MAENNAVIQVQQHRRQVTMLLNKVQGRIQKSLGKIMAPDRFTQICLQLSTQRGMDKVTPENFVRACVRLSQLALNPDPALGQVFLIPYGKDLQTQVGYKGYIEMAYRSDRVGGIYAEPVYLQFDKFEYWHDENGIHFLHVQDLEREDDPTAEPDLVYARCKVLVGSRFEWVTRVLTRNQVRARRDRSQGYQNAKTYNKPTPWETDIVQMYRKTAIRALADRIPQSTEIARALALDADASKEEAASYMDVDFEDMGAEPSPDPEPPRQTSKPAPEPPKQQAPDPPRQQTQAPAGNGNAPQRQEQPEPGPENLGPLTGGLKLEDFNPGQISRFQLCLGKTRPQVREWLAAWSGTKDEAIQEMENVYAERQNGDRN
jgi:recombination protein RecT